MLTKMTLRHFLFTKEKKIIKIYKQQQKNFFFTKTGYSFVAPHLRKSTYMLDLNIANRPEMNQPTLEDVYSMQRRVNFILFIQFSLFTLFPSYFSAFSPNLHFSKNIALKKIQNY